MPGGTVGEVTDFGRSPEFYDVQLSYSICGKQYFYGHRKQSNDWFIRELLHGGIIGSQTDAGNWSTFYETQYTYSHGDQHFLYVDCI